MTAPERLVRGEGLVAEPLLDRRTARRPHADASDLGVLRAAGVLRDVDVHFARTAARLAGESDPRVLLGLAVASRAPGAGHVCADLDASDRLVRLESGSGAVRWPDPEPWRAALAASGVVATPAAHDAGGARPLVLDGTRLYLARYWDYQRRLLAALRERASVVRDDVDDATLAAGLDRLFPRPGGGSDGPDLQRVAACAAVLRGLSVITGGPGTGKTTTVCAVLALLADQALSHGVPAPRIALAAPTGKAAARLAEAIAGGLARLGLAPDVAAAIPRTASTLHRLLGWQPRTPTRFRHDERNPLPVDVVVVDEASMVDLALIAKLVDAVPSGARLVLLGDRDQLASVEAGSILADVCGDAANAFSPTFGGRLASLTGERMAGAAGEPAPTRPAPVIGPAIGDCVVRLVKSHRFRDDGGIGVLARAINDGDAERVLAVLGADGGPGDATGQVAFVPLDVPSRAGPTATRAAVAPVLHLALAGYRRAVQADGPAAALRALERFRVLTAHREGPLGVAALNPAFVAALAREGLVDRDAASATWFHGQPVIVTENDGALELFNGDVGVVLREVDGRLRAWFPAAGGGVRGLAPARLPAHETVFAMTVHKSQGSEFDDVVLVLPPRPSPVLTRELLYTAVSRARRKVTIVGSPGVLRAGIAERVQRASGLREGLWGA